jgi:hypothetical protein
MDIYNLNFNSNSFISGSDFIKNFNFNEKFENEIYNIMENEAKYPISEIKFSENFPKNEEIIDYI